MILLTSQYNWLNEISVLFTKCPSIVNTGLILDEIKLAVIILPKLMTWVVELFTIVKEVWYRKFHNSFFKHNLSKLMADAVLKTWSGDKNLHYIQRISIIGSSFAIAVLSECSTAHIT